MVAATPTTLSKDANRFDESSSVDKLILNRAVQSLQKYHADTASKTSSVKQSTPLFGERFNVQVQFSLSHVPNHPSPCPVLIDIPYSLNRLPQCQDMDEDGLEEVEVCLLVKDTAKEWIQELIEKFPKQLSSIKKVLTLTSLRKKYSRFEDRRSLMHRFDFFLADDRILPMLGKELGKSFFQAKKQPVPIRITKKGSLPSAVEKCLRGTFMVINAGTCITVKAGYTSMASTKLSENIQAVIKRAVTKIPRGWSNVSSISIKTPKSVSLPIYNKTREQLEEIAKIAEVQSSSTESPSAISVKLPQEVQDGKTEIKNKSKKLKLSSKSPLVKALKKQKDQDSQEKNISANNKTKKVETTIGEEVKITEKAAKALKKNKSPMKGMKEQDGRKEKRNSLEHTVDTKLKVVEKPSKKQRKDNGATSPITEIEGSSDTKTEPAFIASKKYKGGRKGYVFMKGSDGLGFYKDVLPVITFTSNKSRGASPKNTNKNGKGMRGKAGKRNSFSRNRK